jgi:hypothetical protein
MGSFHRPRTPSGSRLRIRTTAGVRGDPRRIGPRVPFRPHGEAGSRRGVTGEGDGSKGVETANDFLETSGYT